LNVATYLDTTFPNPDADEDTEIKSNVPPELKVFFNSQVLPVLRRLE